MSQIPQKKIKKKILKLKDCITRCEHKRCILYQISTSCLMTLNVSPKIFSKTKYTSLSSLPTSTSFIFVNIVICCPKLKGDKKEQLPKTHMLQQHGYLYLIPLSTPWHHFDKGSPSKHFSPALHVCHSLGSLQKPELQVNNVNNSKRLIAYGFIRQ